MDSAKTFYVTTPIYYVNDLPHIGHIFTTIVADVVARYHRMAGEDVRFLTGTDEHGQKIERAAAKEGIPPIALADRVVARYHDLKDRLGFSYDDFIRTSEGRHHRSVAEIVRRIDAAGDLYTARHEGWYCAGCETFYPEKELAAGNTCPLHGTLVEWTSEENVFFRLSRFEKPLLDWYDAHPEAVRPASRLNEVRSFIEGGLKDLSVSRATVSWGIPFPGRPGQTIYVWLDALTNYLSALGFGRDGEDGLYRHFWDHEGATRLHLVGKDILRHHAVYWPAFLLSAGLPLPTTVWAHGWWLRDGRKMSKSVGNVVRPDELVERFGADSLRFFVLREMVFGQDAQFSDEAFIDRFNSDLANDLGNTVSRAVTLSRSAFGGQTPPVAGDGGPLLATARQAVADYRAAMDELAFHRALESLWKLVAETNQYLVTREPWKLIKSEGAREELAHVLWNALEATRIVATALLPFLPKDAPRVLAAIGVETPASSLDALAWGGLPLGARLPEPRPIFPRIDKKAYLESHVEPTSPEATPAAAPASPAATANAIDVPPLDRPQIGIDQFGALDLRVGTVRAAENVPKSKKLLKLTVDLGVETRTVVAGIALAYAPDDLIGKQVVIVANLAPATLMGVESQGMVLAASIDGKPVVLHPAAPVPEGTRVK